MKIPDPDVIDEARQAVDNAVFRIARKADPDAFVNRPPYPGAEHTTRVPRPTNGLRAAMVLRDAAAQEVRRRAGVARGSGLSWRQLASILGVEHAEDAFRAVAVDLGGSHVTTSWRCWFCEQFITDHGPYNGVADDERGHAEACPRHAADVEAERKSWEDE
ncbi:MAG: hypothetical protein PHQ28_03395 [Mycobacterium sp.]|nr:hypothetical protein [Mycobacterium sp.]